MCAVYLTLSLMIDRGHSKAQRMEARYTYRNLVGNLVISIYMKDRINVMMDFREGGCGLNRKEKDYSDSITGNSRAFSFAVLQFWLNVRELM
jgi:hypothetical protein